jgi:hypothetical protein
MFQFSGLALFRVILLQSTRLSHSEIFGLSLVCSYPKLIAAYHVLLRLLLPRHPPYALIRFKYCLNCVSTQYIFTTSVSHIAVCYINLLSQYVKELLQNTVISITIPLPESVMSEELNPILPLYGNTLILLRTKKCGGYRSRTDDPLRARQVL